MTQPTLEEALKQVEELKRERDSWKAKAENMLKFPATAHPTREYLTPCTNYPIYDLADRRGSFLKVRDFLIDEICEDLAPGYEMPEQEISRVRRMMLHNLDGGKLNRGLMVVESGIHILESRGLPADNTTLCKLAILGWCIEWLQAWLLVFDDIMDDSKTRRGKPCWYLADGVGNIAINDGAMLEMQTYKMLKRHFSKDAYYPQLLDLFMETTFQTECGQLLDTVCADLDMSDFSVDRWTLIVKYKTAFYSFYLAVACGMVVAGISDTASFDRAREILMIMGIYFQAQDDFLDCYGTPEQIGKIGTDIQDRKCSWLFVHAYSDPACDREFLKNVYGQCAAGTPEEAKVKELYTKLGLPALYEKYEQESFDKIKAMEGTTGEVPWSVYETFLQKIYKRTK